MVLEGVGIADFQEHRPRKEGVPGFLREDARGQAVLRYRNRKAIVDDGLFQGGNAVGRGVADFAGVERRSAVDDRVNGSFALRFAPPR